MPERVPNVPRTAYTRYCKRIFDVTIAALLTVLVLSWLTPLLAILIRLSSAGPVFFVQQRGGRAGRPFPCYKFRTMRVNASSDILQASDDDGRVTAIGAFLRATHIDELPQLINVLRNHMSLVGPRPHMLYHDMLFSAMASQYLNRQLVKPGITGLAQSAGYFGATPDLFSVSARTKLDTFYVQHLSFALDMRILGATLRDVPSGCVKRLLRK